MTAAPRLLRGDDSRVAFLRNRPEIRIANLDSNQQQKLLKLPPELTGGFEREFRASMRLTQTPREASASVMRDFGAVFADKAGDEKAFHALMKQVYGAGYDAAKAEQFRQQALRGDLSWMPPIRFVDNATLGGAYGAYDSEAQVVYLNKSLLSNPALAVEVYAEEFGHFLDTKLRSTDSLGDEGELFRRLLGGEKLSAKQIANIRAENDHGKIDVNGREVQVEFWNPFKSIGKAFKKVGKAIGGAVKSIGKGIAQTVGTVFGSIGRLGRGVFDAGRALFRGDFGGVGSALLGAVDDAIFRLPQRLSAILFDAGQGVFDSFTGMLPDKIGGFLRGVGGRVFDAGRGLTNAAFDIGRHLLRAPFDVAMGLGRDVFGGLGKIFRGDFIGGLKDIFLAPWNAGKQVLHDTASVFIRGAVGLADAIDAIFGIGGPPRALTDDERAYFGRIYGDSLDLDSVRIKRGGLASKLGDTPRVVGNTIYMTDACYGPDGQLNAYGRSVLDHEMAHVWQHQNGGADYISKALLAQLGGQISSGDRSAAYDWRKYVLEGKRFEDLNPEAQAELIDFITKNIAAIEAGQLLRDPTGRIADSEAFTAYLVRALDLVRQGRGAP